MKNAIYALIGFGVGALVGYAICYKKMEPLTVVEEITPETKTEPEKNPREEKPETVDKASYTTEKPDIMSYYTTIENSGYISPDTPITHDGHLHGHYVIYPDQFSEFSDYETVSLTYYADDVLADENDVEIVNVEELIGEDSLRRFGEFEDDAVYVRNDDRKIDYEILRDRRCFLDVAGEGPRPIVDEE